MDERKKSSMEKEKDNPEVKKRIWGEKKTQYNEVNNRMDKRKKSSMEKEKDNPEVKKRIWGKKKTSMKPSE